ncbi:11986_t:CDS:2, partial [Diversispora eburnea]
MSSQDDINQNWQKIENDVKAKLIKFLQNISFSQASKLLQDANIKFQYGTDFNLFFSYTLCSTYNSKYQRAKYKDKNNLAKILLQDYGSDDVTMTSSKIEELKLSMIIENKQKYNAAKILIISPVNFNNIIEKIHLYIQKSLGDEKLNVFDYSLQYKALNSRGTANTLEKETDFNDFLNEYKKIIGSNKKMGISEIPENSSSSDSNTEKIKVFHKKNKSRAVQKEDLTSEQMTRAQVINELSEKYR